MLAMVVRRLAYSMVVVLVASIGLFWFVHSTTDPLARLRDAAADDPTILVREEKRLGLDKPVATQYLTKMKGYLHGDFGDSIFNGRSVSSQIQTAIWNSTQIIAWTVVLAGLMAVAIGVYGALRQYSALDYTFTGISFLGLSTPSFFLGLIFIQLFTYQVPRMLGMETPIFFSIGQHSYAGAGLVDYFRHLALPVMVLTFHIVGRWSRFQRSSMLEVMSSDYIRTARAKGLPRRKVVIRHGLRNALIPLVVVMGVDIGNLFGGLVVTEAIFSWPGMGKLLSMSVLNGDTAVLLPWLLTAAAFTVVFNLAADVTTGWLDPRIRMT